MMTPHTCPLTKTPVSEFGSHYVFSVYPEIKCYKQFCGRSMNIEDYAKVFFDVSPVFDFINKTGHPYKAQLIPNIPEGKFDFKFQRNIQLLLAKCPLSNLPIEDHGFAYFFPGYPVALFYKKLLQRPMTVEEYITILTPGVTKESPVILKGFTSAKTGRVFSSGVYYDVSQNRISFAFRPSKSKLNKIPEDATLTTTTPATPVPDLSSLIPF